MNNMRLLEQCLLGEEIDRVFSLIYSFEGHFYKVIYLGVYKTANTNTFLVD